MRGGLELHRVRVDVRVRGGVRRRDARLVHVELRGLSVELKVTMSQFGQGTTTESWLGRGRDDRQLIQFI